MIVMAAMRRTALVLCCAMTGFAQATAPTPLTAPLQETQLVAETTAATTTPGPESFTIATAADYVITLTDLGFPAELVSAGVVVTQNGAIAGSAQLAAPATNASVSLPKASGDYTLYVFGVPSANGGVGTFTVCVALAASPSNCINQNSANQTLSFSGNITLPNTTANATVSTLSTPLTITSAGAYTFNFADLSFPTALATQPQVALFQGSTSIIPPGQSTPTITAGTTLNLSAGTYTILSIAQADPTIQEGLYSLSVQGTSVNLAVPVGLLPAAATFVNSSAQNVTLTVSDYAFPGALTSASALLTAGGATVGSASSIGGAQTFSAPAGTLSLWTYGAPGTTAGTFSADVSGGGTDLFTTAQAVAGSSGPSTLSYAYVVPVTSAGAYEATATDLQFPSQLGSLSFAVAQNGTLLKPAQTAAAGSINFPLVVGNAVVLASASLPTTSSGSNNTTPLVGLFDVNVQSTGSSAAVLFDQTQNVNSSPSFFSTQTIHINDSASYDLTLTDLKFPLAFDSLSLVVTRGSQVLGKVFGAGTLSFNSSPGDYLLTFVASPSTATDQQFGLYALSVAYSPPTVTLTSNVASAAAGSFITLSFSSTNATSCTASGGWTGTEPTSSSTVTETLAATTTYTLTCTGPGGSANQSVTVTATAAAASSSHGGGALDLVSVCGLVGLVLLSNLKRRR
jgi:hypothetical protein